MPRPNKIRVLIVDDCIEMSALLKVYLSDPNIETVAANSGEEGCALFRDEKFDVVLLDIEMPGMDGYAALTEMRKLESSERRERTPIMALTAASDITSSRRILSAGFDLHLVKPISRLTLLQTIGQFRKKVRNDKKDALDTETPAREQLGDQLIPFIERRTQDLFLLQRAINGRDYRAIQNLGESLKNVAQSFGLDSLARIGSNLESSALAGKQDAVGVEIDAYNDYLDQLQKEKTRSSAG